MNTRNARALLLVFVLVLSLAAGAAQAIYQKSISLAGTVTLVYTAPTEAPLDAEDYLQMAINAHEKSKPIFSAVRNKANGPVGDMLWGNGSFQKAYETVNAFSWEKPDWMKDPVFAMLRSETMAEIDAWRTEWSNYRQQMYAIASAMEAKGIETNKNLAVSAYNDYIHAAQWHKDPVASFEALKNNALSARAKYLEVVAEEQAVDLKVVEMADDLAAAWELVTALQNYSPANGAMRFAPLQPELESTPELEPTISPEPTLVPAPTPSPATSS
ncbi:MAG: hypothetical protein GX592_05180, partial [Clostridiales bacterium]|nr:hypothetical protein [Clostridiales bacterium]